SKCAWSALAVSQVLASDRAHHRGQQPEDALRLHLELVVDAGRITLRRERETVPAGERPDVRNDPHALGPGELLQLLDDLAKPAKVPLEAVPSRTSPASSWRDARIVGFQDAKLPPSVIVSNTLSTGALMICERVISAIVYQLGVRAGTDAALRT